MDLRSSKVGVNEQHTSPVGLAQREREVHTGERLSLAWHRAGDHDNPGQSSLSENLVLVRILGEESLPGLRLTREPQEMLDSLFLLSITVYKFTDAQRRAINRENAERLVPRLKS